MEKLTEVRCQELTEKTEALMVEAKRAREAGEFGPEDMVVLEDALRALGIEYGILPDPKNFSEDLRRCKMTGNRLELGDWVYKGHLAEKPAGHVVEIQVAKGEGEYSDYYDENPEAAEVTAIVIEGFEAGKIITIPVDEWDDDEWCW